MISSEEASASNSQHQHQDQLKKFKGVRRRKWGKWVSEIRVPGTQDRLWLGSYATAEAAAVAHDIAFFCLRGSSTSLPGNLNFPHRLPPGLPTNLSPRSIQRAASDAGMAIDAQAVTALPSPAPPPPHNVSSDGAVPEVPMWSGGDEHSSGDIIGGSTCSGDGTSAWEGTAFMGQDGHYSCGDDPSFRTPADYNYYYP